MESNENMIYQSINNISFNRDQTAMHFATVSGFSIYELEPVLLKIDVKVEQGTVLVQSQLENNLILFVPSNQHPKHDSKSLIAFDLSKKAVVHQYRFTQAICEIQITNNLLILTFPSQIQCRTLRNNLIYSIDTPNNVDGICAVSYGPRFCIVAPSTELGSISISWIKKHKDIIKSQQSPVNLRQGGQSNSRESIEQQQQQRYEDQNPLTTLKEEREELVPCSDIGGYVKTTLHLLQYEDQYSVTQRSESDLFMCQSSSNIQCNQSGVANIALNMLGTLVAVASKTGTIIRLFDTTSNEKIKEFRRGSYPADIHYMSFSTDNYYFSCCSDKDTIHLFKVNQVNTTSYFGMLSYFVPITGDQWSFAQISTQRHEVSNLQYKVILRTGFALVVSNHMEFGIVKIPESGLVLISQFQQLR